MSSIDERESARYRQDVLLSYRAWQRYLEAQQTILAAAAEAQAGADPFEGLSSGQERAAAAERAIAELPADKRELFEAIYDAERTQVQRQLDAEAPVRGGTVTRADPDEVARRALAHLLAEAQGLHRDDRRGLVPRGTPEAIKWLAIDLAAIAQSPPSATDYQVLGRRQAARRSLIVNFGFAALALVAIPTLLILLQRPGASSAAGGLPTANGAELVLWDLATVRDGQGEWSLPVKAAQTRWPPDCASAEQARACWQAGTFRPLELCLPAERLASSTTLLLDAANGQPTRVYALRADPAGPADLVVSPCSAAGEDVPPRYGVLEAVQPLAVLAPGERGPDGVQVDTITVRGRGEDPELPEGRMELTVAVQDDGGHDWVARAPTVLLADGETVTPGAPERSDGQLRFDYLIPEQAEPFVVQWQVTTATDQVVRYRATLDPPPSRHAVLRAGLEIADVAVAPSQQTMAVTLTLRNTGERPLVLVAADLGFQTQTTRREVAATALQQPLEPGERRVVEIDLPLENGVLLVGPFRYQLAVRR
ncbi:MAG: hypothetical protein OHK0015_36000 [Chloroflexi bacterium OHK40]